MTRFDYRKRAAVVALATLLAAPALAGTLTELEVTDHQRARVGVTRYLVEGLDLRAELAPRNRKEREGVVIFRGERTNPRVIVLKGEEGHFIVNQTVLDKLAAEAPAADRATLDPATIERAWTMAERIADPEARQRALDDLERRYGPREGAPAEEPLEFQERGVRDKEGYPCVRYDVVRGGERVAVLWMTDFANLEGGRQTGKVFEAFGEFYSQMMEQLAKMPDAPGSLLGRDDNPFEAIFRLGRFPIVAEEYENGELVRTSVLKSIQVTEHPPGTFKPSEASVERPFGG